MSGDEVAYLRQQLADAQTLARQYAAGHAEWYLKHGPHIENEGERIAWGEVAERDATIAALREQLRRTYVGDDDERPRCRACDAYSPDHSVTCVLD